ncbi:IucA/IucC family protein [Modicisalibacter zincidurans]|uniref:IucA/IucC family siderophore biosynthesis protein n=1 Tax=Modicisalibacter zincidurans TaxID=1178777 RepID=A0ABP9R3M8_9GAMM|nr:IucA/IucC family C-terminal-domain containing protein [Halomonas zincidurans]
MQTLDAALAHHWPAANRALIAKMIGELSYEQILAATADGEDNGYRLELGAAGVWRYRARLNLWGQPMVDPQSLTPPPGERPEAADFLLALAPALGMHDGQVAEHLEDLFATLRADCQLREARRGLSANAAIRLAEPERQRLRQALAERVAYPADYRLLPVHPWQWQQILAEPAAAVLSHAQYARLETAPYRYHELFGVIWRESLVPRLGDDEQALLMAELMQCDERGRPWLAAYIDASGVTADRWLIRLFEATLVPMWHLMCRYGVSLIAHGQNLTVILRDGVPHRLALKDFQGDLRLVDEEFAEAADLPEALKRVTVRLPPDKLIHDLQTGHFVTTLRFIAPLAESCGVSETRFYRLCGAVLERYVARHPELAERFARFDLFAPRILRLTLNRAKFLHATDHAAERMLAEMQLTVANPLHHAGAQTPDKEVLDA